MKKNIKILIYSLAIIGVFIILTNSCKKEVQLPVLITSAVSSITQLTASGGGNITSDGGSPVISRGICWGTSADPTTSGSKTNDGTGTGSFTSAITGLTAGTTYHVRAYAVNTAGTAYGNDVTFNSSAATAPVLTTTGMSALTTTTGTSGGNITSDGGAEITARGVCWSTTANPTTSDNKTTDGTGTGTFTSSLSGLTAGTGYFLRSYATNSVGTTYGNELSFTTLQPLTLATTEVTGITQTTAASGGNIVSDGGSAVTARGVCWNTSASPTTDNNKTSDGTGSGSFTSTITGLTPGTIYYVRAYATNDEGTAYGNEVSFTSGAAAPTLTTVALGNITPTSATSGGTITSDGGATITQHGICWSTSTNPTISNSLTYDGPGSENYTSNLVGLTPNTTYYVRAWATNSAGTSYGNELVFITLPVTTATLTTTTAASITSTTASSGGEITDDGGAGVTDRGVVWNTLANPTTANFKTSEGIGTGIFVSSLTGLAPNTTYYYRAYAVNSSGTVYGNQMSFTTIAGVPTLTTTSVSAITQTTATSGGNISSTGGESITERGICWSTTTGPTISDSKTSDGTATGSYASSLTGLTLGTKYYVRAFATNSVGTAYGNEINFTTTAALLPSLTTTAFSSITQTSASSGGTITADGGATVTERGVCWGLSSAGNPTIAGNKTSDGTGTGAFTSSISGLTGNTSYYVRAYATNAAGTEYGNTLLLTTSPVAPSLVTTTITSITQTTASSGGNITSTGGSSITGRGVCWSTSSGPTTADSKTSNGAASGSFTSNITGLTENTKYYVRSYATNVAGTGYGDEVSFTTSAALLPTLTTTAISSISKTTASSGGNITNDGGGVITERGVCWSTSASPSITDSNTSNGTGAGTFTSSITGLSATTTYHVRAYATNSAGTAYGNDLTFTSTAYDIGESLEGGIIAYLLQPGNTGYDAAVTHGIIAAESDQSAGVQWYNGTALTTFAWDAAIGTGQANTTKIVSTQGGGTYAASICDDLSLNTYTDWYLPSTSELYLLYLNKVAIGGFTDTYYWTSTESGTSNLGAYMIDFTTGLTNTVGGKAALYRVRAVRSF